MAGMWQKPKAKDLLSSKSEYYIQISLFDGSGWCRAVGGRCGCGGGG